MSRGGKSNQGLPARPPRLAAGAPARDPPDPSRTRPASGPNGRAGDYGLRARRQLTAPASVARPSGPIGPSARLADSGGGGEPRREGWWVTRRGWRGPAAVRPLGGGRRGGAARRGARCVSREGRRVQRVRVLPGQEPDAPEAWMAGRRETKSLKPVDKAIRRMVSESPGRNGSERGGSLESTEPRRPSVYRAREGSMGRRSLADAAWPLRRGGSDSTVTRTRRATGEALLVPPRNRRKGVRPITSAPGKWVATRGWRRGPQ